MLTILNAVAARVVPPAVYRAPRAPSVLKIDGDLSKPEWREAPWSEPFFDIRGAVDAPPESQPNDACETRVKMMWDDEFLYIGAILHSDREVPAIFEERNSPIFHKDSDFEVFVDPSSSCHDYKELELNAKNVVWNLLLTRPYADGGGEHSGRIAKEGEPSFYEVYQQRTATRVLKGKLNDPSAEATTWSVEIALSHQDTLDRQPSAERPAVGRRWRINFSRVEERGSINWTWSPQRVWDPSLQRYAGQVNMHLPDAWGYVEFATSAAEQPSSSSSSSSSSTCSLPLGETDEAAARVASEPVEIARAAAMVLYYAQHAFQAADADGAYATSMEELGGLCDEQAIQGCDAHLATGAKGFVATVTHRASGVAVSVTNERFVHMHSQASSEKR